MRRIALILSALSVAAASQAALNLNIDTAYQTVPVPSSGTLTVLFTGTVDILLPTFDPSSAVLEFPGSASNVFLTASFHADFLNYLGTAAPGQDYTGNLFTVDVPSTTVPDFYYLNGSGSGMANLAEFIVSASDGVNTATDNEFYGVNVVPEPGTMAALAIGAAALLRKRRK